MGAFHSLLQKNKRWDSPGKYNKFLKCQWLLPKLLLAEPKKNHQNSLFHHKKAI